MSVEDKFNVNLNQNLWALLVSYAALGAADHYHLSWWFLWLARILATLMTASVVAGVLFYTVHYCARKGVQTAKLRKQPRQA
jgi:thiamine transporter ThiT